MPLPLTSASRRKAEDQQGTRVPRKKDPSPNPLKASGKLSAALGPLTLNPKPTKGLRKTPVSGLGFRVLHLSPKP